MKVQTSILFDKKKEYAMDYLPEWVNIPEKYINS